MSASPTVTEDKFILLGLELGWLFTLIFGMENVITRSFKFDIGEVHVFLTPLASLLANYYMTETPQLGLNCFEELFSTSMTALLPSAYY